MTSIPPATGDREHAPFGAGLWTSHGTHPVPVPDEAVAAALKAVPGYQATAREPVWLYPPEGQVRAMLEAAAPHIVGPMEAERDAFRDQARILGEQKAEWLCGPCKTIHPWRDGDRFTAACPDCGTLMVPTSVSTRALQRAEAKLAAIAERAGTWAGLSARDFAAAGHAILAIIGTEEET